MNIVVATSRGRGLKAIERKRNDVVMSVHPGGKLWRLKKEALHLIKEMGDSDATRPTLVYFVAGIPDITIKKQANFKLYGRHRHYEEVVMPESNLDTLIKDMTFLFVSTAECIKKAGATPVFATIAPMSIATWNSHRLHKHRTTHLTFFKNYDIMQTKLELLISSINKNIHQINKSNNVHTPRLSKSIMYQRRGHSRCRYGMLVDGVHPSLKLSASWIDTLDRVFDLNKIPALHSTPDISTSAKDNIYDSDVSDDSDSEKKRCWLY